MSNLTCHVRRTDKRPTTFTNVRGSVDVGVGFEATSAATERSLVRPILLRSVTAARALSRCVARVHENNRDAGKSCLVFDEESKLTERPRGKFCSLLLPRNPDPARDSLQFFKGYRNLRVFGFGNEAFRNAVVDVSGVERVAAAHSLQASLRGSRSLLLEFGAESTTAVSDPAQGRARVSDTVRIGRDVHDTEVYANYVAGLRLGRFDFYGKREEKVAGPSNAELRTRTAHHEGFVLWTAAVGYRGPEKTHAIRCQAVVASVNRDRSNVSERNAVAFGEIVRGSYFRDCATSSVSAESVDFASPVVRQVMQIETSEDLRRPGFGADPIGALVHIAEQGQEPRLRLGIRHEFQPDGDRLHRTILIETTRRGNEQPWS